MIRGNDYGAFNWAVAWGQFDLIERMLDLVPTDDQLRMIRFNMYAVFAMGAEYGNLLFMKRIIGFVPKWELQPMLEAGADRALRNARRGNNKEVITFLQSLSPESAFMPIADSLVLEGIELPPAEVEGELFELLGISQNSESSMIPLTADEEGRLAATVEHYQAVLDEVGEDILFEELLDKLRARYEEHPATIQKDGSEIRLPLEWDAFYSLPTQLGLTTAQWKEALKAYYTHKDHTVIRYLSRPNPWMSLIAEHIVTNAAGEGWSTFEEHKRLILLLWLAAQDKTAALTEGFTLEGRVEEYIVGLALTGRAHNWDKFRDKIDKDGKKFKEYYDDLEGDKPSCNLGVRRRLFQSLKGHPLSMVLTEGDIKEELQAFVLAHFKAQISEANREVLLSTLRHFLRDTKRGVIVPLAELEPLKALDISPDQQTEFVQQMAKKYGHKFIDEATFSSMIEGEFALSGDASNPKSCLHALKFASYSHINLEVVLQPSVPCASGAGEGASAGAGSNERTASSPRSLGLFAEGRSVVADASVGTEAPVFA